MEYESRISRVAAQLEMNQRDIERLYQAISELRSLMQERFDHIDLSFREERKYIDMRFIEDRKHTDLSIGELQARLNEMRREATVNMCWLMGTLFVIAGLILSIGAKVIGIY